MASYGRLTNFKMAAAAILNLLPVSILSTHEVYFIARTLCYNFISIALLLSEIWPYENFANLACHRDPQKALPCAKPRHMSHRAFLL